LSNRGTQSSRDIRLLLAGMGLNSLPFGYTLVVLPIYLHDIGFSAESIGAIAAVSAIANTIGLVPFAIAADRYGRRKFVVGGCLSATLAYVLFAFTHDMNILLLASAIGGVGIAGGLGAAIWTPAWTALLAEKASPEARTSAFAWGQGVWTVALTSGSAMSVLPTLLQTNFQVRNVESYQFTFVIFAFIAIISGLVLLPVPEDKASSTNIHETVSILPRKSLKQILKFSTTFGLVGFGSGLAVQLLSLWFYKVYGADEALSGPWFAAAEFTSLIIVPIIPALTRRFGSSKSVLGTQGISAIFLASMIFAPTYQIAGLLFVIRNFFMNISWPIQQSYLMGTVTVQERASASAITSTVWGVGGSIGPILAGYFLNQSSSISIAAPLLCGGVVYLLSAVGFYFLFRGIPPPEEAVEIGHML
jgi:MFS family permease